MTRVERALAELGLPTRVVRMPASTRTAAEAAATCGCAVAQIVKSMVFEGRSSGRLVLLLVSGAHDVDLDRAAAAVGEGLSRADPKRVRAETGFAIGGVSPVGHLAPIGAWMDASLLEHEVVWAAAGAPDAVFAAPPAALRDATGAAVFAVA
ncbi:YbaK/EbsC family protein [Jannaschia sp. LMIT008]|uniref:YbaK/EbsC family protein n=1 Tax=Jannaschia maritima TaxID=3032585 RepID=UPI0028121503|nr:YbaK/EbsC family protein [Jannaschia sp. LMIT008]